MESAVTPYERFLFQSIEDQRKQLDDLYNRFAHANLLEKRFLKPQIEAAVQNIDILSRDLEKYKQGLSWLREPSNDRDEKAGKLGDIEESGQTPKAATLPSPNPVVGRPVIGKPASETTQKPAVARSIIGKPIGQPVKKQE
ncbi:MAG: hypothetical protein ACYC7D_14690 [Nitrososphaerales archaeon]